MGIEVEVMEGVGEGGKLPRENLYIPIKSLSSLEMPVPEKERRRAGMAKIDMKKKHTAMDFTNWKYKFTPRPSSLALQRSTVQRGASPSRKMEFLRKAFASSIDGATQGDERKSSPRRSFVFQNELLYAV
jgi:hypothetical protein